PFATRSITDLVMVLQADHMGRRGHVSAAGTARPSAPEPERFALVNKAFLQRTCDLLRPAKVLIVAFVLSGEKGMDGMMKIVTPNGIQAKAAGVDGPYQLFVILVGFGDHADGAAHFFGKGGHVFRDFGENVARRIVIDRLHRVQAQPVHVILAYPIERVLHKVGAYAIASGVIVIDGLAPRGCVMSGEIGTEKAEIISFIAEVVVDHVKDDAQAGLMRGVDQALEPIGAAIAGLHSVS